MLQFASPFFIVGLVLSYNKENIPTGKEAAK
jgi:hypothetical protein